MAKKIPVSAMKGDMYTIVADLPRYVLQGIGQVVAAHALLENRVQELLFDAMKVDYPQGRVAFENYRDPAVLFGIVRKLMDSRGIKVEENLQDLEDNIRSCTRDRNILAHSIWLRRPDGTIALRQTEGQFSTPDGIHVRAFLPESRIVAAEEYGNYRNAILMTTEAISRLKKRVNDALASSPEKPSPQSGA